MKRVKFRNEQFENIVRLKAVYIAAGNPVVSMDTTEELQVNDHDFSSQADGIVIPHGIYDIQRNSGYINLGTSHDSSEFACDCIRNWWYNQGRFDHLNATSILVLCDGGGSNSSGHYIFKQDLQALADEIGIDFRIAHYPPYTSKYNPIEHRLFPHVTRACQGIVFRERRVGQGTDGEEHTRQGLKVTVQIADKVYQTRRKAAKDFKETMRIVFDEFLPQWNYTAVPSAGVI